MSSATKTLSTNVRVYGGYVFVITGIPEELIRERIEVAPFIVIRKLFNPVFYESIGIEVHPTDDGIEFDHNRITGGLSSPLDRAVLVDFALSHATIFPFLAKVVGYLSRQPGWPRYELQKAEAACEAERKSGKELKEAVRELQEWTAKEWKEIKATKAGHTADFRVGIFAEIIVERIDRLLRE